MSVKITCLSLCLVLMMTASLAVFAQQSPAPQNSPQTPSAQTTTVWSCPVHSVVTEKGAGKCPICRRDLVEVNVEVTWTCPDRPEVDRPSPGRCPDGSAAEAKYRQPPHATHAPRHGGLFFMAPDMWHHLEATYSSDGLFRVYLYDDYTKPLALDQIMQTLGRVVTKENFDTATKTTTELAVAPLKLAPNGEYLEARVEGLAPPAEMTAKLKFKDTPEYRFDFAFPTFSEDKGPGTVPGVDSVMLEVPDNAGEVLKLLGDRSRLLGDLVRKGAFTELWVPALQAKDLALALDIRTRDLPVQRRAGATGSVERLVRAAWLLDAYGDLGNRSQVEEAYSAFAKAAAEIASNYSQFAVQEGRR